MQALAKFLLMMVLVTWFTVPTYAQEILWNELNDHVVTLYRQGKYPEAVKVDKEGLKLAERTFGPDHPHVATFLNNLAVLYRAQGRYEEPEPLFKRALVIKEAALAEELKATKAARKEFLMGLRLGGITGHSKYHISFPGGESELEFPLGNFFLGLEGALVLKNPKNDRQDKARLAIGWLTNVGGDSGTMKDSDWSDGYLWGYTESDSQLRAHIVDVSGIYNFWPLETISIGPMIGYRYQYFDFNIWNYSGTYYGIPVSRSGHVLDYTVKYHIPYYGLNSDFLFRDTFWFNSRVAFSWAFANDRDDHLLRYKLSEASCDGPGVIVNINANWEFLPNWLLQVGGEYTYINAEGEQDQSWYGDDPGTAVDETGWAITGIDDKITYSAWIISAYLKYKF